MGDVAPARSVTSSARPSTLTVVAIATVAGYLPLFLLGALAVQMQPDLGYGPSGQGALVSTFNMTVAVAAATLGPLAMRLGWQRAIRTSAVVLGIAMLCIGIAAQQWIVLAALLVVCAVANSLILPSGNVAIVADVPQHKRGSAFGLRQAAVPLAALLGGLAVPLVAVRLGWRAVYLIVALVPAVAAITTRRPPSTTDGAVPSPAANGRPRLEAPLLMLFGLSAMGALMVNSTNGFLVTTAVSSGIDPGAAGLLLMAGSAIALAVRVLVGLALDRVHDVEGFGLIAVLLALGATGFALVASGAGWAVVIGAALGLGAGTGWPGVLHYVVTNEHPEHAGGVASLMLTFANVGGFVGPLAFGLLVERVSSAVAWRALACAALVALSLVLMSGRGYARRRGGS